MPPLPNPGTQHRIRIRIIVPAKVYLAFCLYISGLSRFPKPVGMEWFAALKLSVFLTILPNRQTAKPPNRQTAKPPNRQTAK